MVLKASVTPTAVPSELMALLLVALMLAVLLPSTLTPSSSVVTVLSRAISDRPVPADWEDRPDARAWIAEMGRRLASRVPDADVVFDFVGGDVDRQF